MFLKVVLTGPTQIWEKFHQTCDDFRGAVLGHRAGVNLHSSCYGEFASSFQVTMVKIHA